MEVRAKNMAQIDRDTARTWAARAAAYKSLAMRAEASGDDARDIWSKYEDARHEALEHAGMADPSGRTVKAVARAIEEATRPRRRRRR